MARVTMRAVEPGEVPPDGGTAVQLEPDRPVWTGNGPDDYVCVQCGTVLAAAMHHQQMTLKVRVKCARCGTVNVAITDIKGAPIRIR
jgi:phage FluMu protein Com